jgi:arylsulfatase
MQSCFLNGPVTAASYAGDTQIPLEPEPIHSRRRGSRAEVIATYDAEFGSTTWPAQEQRVRRQVTG